MVRRWLLKDGFTAKKLKHSLSYFIKLIRFFCIEQDINLIKSSKRVSHKIAFDKFFKGNEQLMSLREHIPPQYLNLHRLGTSENFYLVCTNIAKTIASHVKVDLPDQDQIIAETNAGLGLIATELLESGVKSVRLYESCADFRRELKDFGIVYPGQVELFTKNIYDLHRYSFMDKHDHGNRVEQLLKNVPKKSWSDEPVMTIVGPMPSLTFLKYLVRCLCLQNHILTYGRFRIFAIMRPRHYAILKATPRDNLRAYQYWTLMFNLLCDYELLDKFPREMFLPWETSSSKCLRNSYVSSFNKPSNLEPDKLYLVRIVLKKELPVAADNLLHLFYFGKHLFGRGTNKVIPSIDCSLHLFCLYRKWVPGCGLNILLPQLKHPEYFEDINIFTQFRELTPHQLLAVFKELVNYPSFAGSPFTAMVENDLLKAETIETGLADSKLLEKNVEDIEQKLDVE